MARPRRCAHDAFWRQSTDSWRQCRQFVDNNRQDASICPGTPHPSPLPVCGRGDTDRAVALAGPTAKRERVGVRVCGSAGGDALMDKLASIRAFTRVVAHGSFSEAARELRLSRSAVSKHVIDLEEELGVQLLNRTTRSASPTENGQAYYERCRTILADLDEADRTVSRAQAEPRGLLRVNAPMSFGTLHLGRAVAEFMERYAELQIQLILSDQLIDPVQEGFDVTLRIADLPSSNLIARKIVPAKRVVCASPSYLELRGVPQRPADLR